MSRTTEFIEKYYAWSELMEDGAPSEQTDALQDEMDALYEAMTDDERLTCEIHC